ncbi:transglycosylase domain-containing protein [Saccharothrix algeriensis]|uniref:Membrane peptidoglycan carboxypeptidase n=2 Tax=Saccharothrix algeriensis TaxID=173560 RepID=A0ABS2S8J7_9PSEU|nr:transglycosylase domain-containing protein [Saccharothrix algeriensis]MBM7812254.1 membrane peptidoglycan carboxypeptidase [Saccharothrix algeriensis]
MNDQHDDRQRGGEPQWPTGEDPDGGAHAPRRGAGDQPERPNTPPGGFARPQGGPRPGTPPGGIPRTPPPGGPQGGRPPGTPPGGIPQGGGPRGAGTPPGGIPQGGPGRRPEQGGPGAPGGRPGGPARPGGPNTPPPGAAGADPNATRQVPRGAGRAGTPPGGIRRPHGPVPPGRPPMGGPAVPGGPRRPGEEPTDLLPPVHQTVAREPELLTHREDEIAIEPFYEDEYDDEPTPEEAKALRRRKVWRRVRRIGYVGLFLLILGPIVAFAIAYQLVIVPNPEQVAAEQAKVVTILYDDESVMTKIAPSGANRTLVKYEDLPEQLKRAVFAVEDPTFETNPGFDFTAIARAVWYQVTDRNSGGSGLTQQYVKQASQQDDNTLSRKFTELVKAYKMSEQQDKRDILTAYLNTIYLGRSAYGVKEAAKVYFNKENLNDLTPSECALLAGMIQSPSLSEDTEYVTFRWNHAMDQLLRFNWITKEYREAERTPPPLRPLAEVQQSGLEGPRLLIQNQVLAELEDKENGLGWDMKQAHQSGITIHTTIDPEMQTAAEEVIKEVMEGQTEGLRQSLTAIDPHTGAVRAYHAGMDGNGIDYARGIVQEAGSSFKPFDLVAALQRGKGLGSTYDGVSPKTFPGGPGPADDVVIRNSSDRNNSCGKQCSLREAMEMSLNTVFYDLVANEIGPQAVAEAAFQAGIPRTVKVDGREKQLLVGENGGPPGTGIAIGGGEAQVRPFDMASAYASFAARGVYHEPYFIKKITSADGEPLKQHEDVTRSAFGDDQQKSRDIADNVTESLKPVIKYSELDCAGRRECAGKTGTHELPGSAEQNSKAWMVGYTPSLSTAVWMGRDQGNEALVDANGKAIFGSDLPGEIWRKFMDRALEGTQPEKFPKANPMGEYEKRRVVTTVPTTTPKKEEEQKPTTTTSTRPTTEETTTPPTTTRPTPPTCIGRLCQTTTVPDPDPDPIGGGGPPTR